MTIAHLVRGVALLSLLFGATARAECSPENWKDCAGKPWVIGEPETPIGEKWWPHPLWGEGDEAGASNWYTRPEVVRRALAEADRGRVYSLARPYDAEMPLFGQRRFVLRIPATPTGGPFGANRIIWHDEFLATEIGQVGTQFDGLGHIGVMMGGPGDKDRMVYYNGYTETEVGGAYGLRRIGVEKLHPIVARGILLDIAGAKGVEMLEKGYVITMADVRAALERQGMADFRFAEGDVVIFHTGWGRLWKKDNATFNSGEPGIGMEVARWLSDEVRAGLVGADTWAVEAVPNPDPGCAFCVHQHLITRHGIFLHENLDPSGLVADGVWTFTYVFAPMPIVGATGSAGHPIAID